MLLTSTPRQKTFIFFRCAICLLFVIGIYTTRAQVSISGSTSVCAGQTVNYSITPVTGGIYTWTPVNGTLSGTGNSVSVQWDTAGTGTISVVIIDANNQVTNGTLSVTIHPNPHPAITWPAYPTCPVDSGGDHGSVQGGHHDPCINVCKGSSITYSTPLNPGSSYFWIVNGATTFSGQGSNSVNINWDSTASGDITVIETTTWGCVDSAKLCIKKADIPIAFFTTQSSICLNSFASFTNYTTGATSYQWYFGDGGYSTAFSPTHAYANAGNYTITLVAMNDCHCTDTFRTTIHVDSMPGPDIECPATVCAGDTQTYHTNSTGCVYNWIVTGGSIIAGAGTQTITVAWGPGMIGYVSLYVTGCSALCSDTTTIAIPIIPIVATISGPNKVCPGDCEVYSLPMFMGCTYSWSISSTGVITNQDCNEVTVCWPNNIMFSNDTLTVSYYDSFLNCGGTGLLPIHLRPQMSLFGNSTACSNGNTTVSAFPGIACNWSIIPAGPTFTGNGTSSINISWNGAVGPHTVTAVSLSPNSTCNDSAKLLITVSPAPSKPVITGDTIICPNNAYNYCASGNNISWFVTGGTPSTGNGSCITVTWGGSGPYVVQAIQQMSATPNCSSDTAGLNVYSALPIGTPNITGPGTGCANGTTAFSNTTAFPGTATLTWSVGPANAGSIILGQGTNNVTVQWGNNAPAVDTVRLTVTVCGQTTTSFKVINLLPAPTPSIVVNGIFCPGNTVTLSATGGTYTAYQWSGPGGFSSTSNPSSAITLQGYYHVTVTDANGCTGAATKQVVPLQGPVASISTSDQTAQCIGVPFSVQLNALANPNYTYNWSNANSGNPINVTSAGTYWVTVTDQNGCTSLSNAITITVDSCNGSGSGTCVPGGTVSFLHPAFYGCNPLSYTNTSVNASSFTWDFGDLTFSNATSPTHTYSSAGFYLVTLSGYVPNLAGSDSCLLHDTAHVQVPLAPDFSFISGCAKDSVCFTDLSTFTPGNNINSWSWNFGDASTSTAQNPCHKYAAGGTYIVTLTVGNGTCTSTISDTVVVLPQPVAAFNFSNPACVNSNIPFTDASTPAIGLNYWSWTFGDAGTSLNQNPNHSYSTTGVFTVQLIVSNSFGCTDTTSNTITIVNANIPGVIAAYPDTIVCAGTNVLLVAPSCSGCSYVWSNGGTNDSVTVSTTGTYTVTIIDANGCRGIKSINILVHPAPSVSILNYGADEFCLGGSTYLTGVFSLNYLYNWTSNDANNNGSQLSGISVGPSTPGVYYYILAVTDTTTGCADTSNPYYITVNDTPVAPLITALGPTTVCAGDTIMLVATHPDPTVTFHWNTGDISDTIMVTASGCYTCQVVDSNGCDKSSSLCVTVNPAPDICQFWTGCLDTCRPFTIVGPSGNTFYQWLLNGNIISGANSQTYTATVNGTYSLIMTNSFGCTDTTGGLQLTLHDCPVDTPCVDLVTDSVYCDGQGHVIFVYHTINNSGHNINQTNLLVLGPNLNTLYSPVTTLDTVMNGDTSAMHHVTIYNEQPENIICYIVHVQELDSNGTELFCCNSDTVCITTPPCDTTNNCCYLHILSDSVWCTGHDSSGLNTYGFNVLVNGCGQLHLQTPTGTITSNTNFTLTPGNTLISGTFTDAPLSNGNLCLTFTLTQGNQICADTTVCMALPHCDSTCCYLRIIRDSVWCKGVDTAGNNIYNFRLRVDGCGHLLLQTSDGTITSPTTYNLTPGPITINGVFVDNPPVTGSLCITLLLTNGPIICADTTICMHLPECDTVRVLPECYLQFDDTICQGQSTSFLYTGPTGGSTFTWNFPGGNPSTAAGPGPHVITYATVGCYPVALTINTANQVRKCYDSICVVAPPIASVTQVGNTLYAYPAGYSYQWYIGPPNWQLVNGEVNQFFTPSFSTYFCVVVSNGDGCSDTACIDHQWVGIDELSNAFSCAIVPNPNKGNFELVIKNSAGGKMSYTIYNTMGEIAAHYEFESAMSEEKRIPVSQNFAAGVYFVRFESEKKSSVQKLVVK